MSAKSASMFTLELTSEEKLFLEQYLPSQRTNNEANDRSRKLPHVTLTYASSLDGQISLSPGVRTTLSGERSKAMTHYLRSQHDYILIGANTAIADDPSLACRYPGAKKSPKPVIIDPNLRWDIKESKMLKELLDAFAGDSSQEARQKPLIIARSKHIQKDSAGHPHYDVAVVEGDDDCRFDWHYILATFFDGEDSIMIEGGATILSGLLAVPDLVNSVIVTIAPTWLGQGGVHVSPAARYNGSGVRENAATLIDPKWHAFGQDIVLCGTLPHAVKDAHLNLNPSIKGEYSRSGQSDNKTTTASNINRGADVKIEPDF